MPNLSISVSFLYYFQLLLRILGKSFPFHDKSLTHVGKLQRQSVFFLGVFFIQGERNQRTLEVCVGPTEPINTNI